MITIVKTMLLSKKKNAYIVSIFRGKKYGNSEKNKQIKRENQELSHKIRETDERLDNLEKDKL